MSVEITLSQAFNHHHALNKKRDQTATASSKTPAISRSNTNNQNDSNSIYSAQSRYCTPKVSKTSLKSIESTTATLHFSSSIDDFLPSNIDLILLNQTKQKKTKRYMVKTAKSSSHLNKDLPPLPPSECPIEFVSLYPF